MCWSLVLVESSIKADLTRAVPAEAKNYPGKFMNCHDSPCNILLRIVQYCDKMCTNFKLMLCLDKLHINRINYLLSRYASWNDKYFNLIRVAYRDCLFKKKIKIPQKFWDCNDCNE